MIHLDGIQWKYIHVGNDYVNTHSLAYTLNKFPLIFFFQKANFFLFSPLPPIITTKIRNHYIFFITYVNVFFLGPPPPQPKTEMMVRAEAQRACKQYSIKEL